MMMKKLIIVLTVLLGLSAALNASFTEDDIGTTGAAFLKLGKGVRAVSMGEAYAGLSDDVNAVFWNPAGLNNLKAAEVSAMHSIWFENIYFDYITAAVPRASGVYGISVNYLGMDDIDKYTNSGVSSDETFSPYDMFLSLSYANTVRRSLFGANLKVIQSVIDDENAIAFAADLGYMLPLSEKLTIGSALQNIGTTMKFRDESDPLPLNLKLGVSYRELLNNLILAADINMPYDNIPSFHFGAEYSYLIKKIILAARTGYKTTTVSDLDAMSGLSAGMGFAYSDFFLDYSWVPYGDLGNTHRISLTYKFQQKTPSESSQ